MKHLTRLAPLAALSTFALIAGCSAGPVSSTYGGATVTATSSGSANYDTAESTSSYPSAAPSPSVQSMGSYRSSAPSTPSAPPSVAPGTSAPSSGYGGSASASVESAPPVPEPHPQTRQGLATEWGESRHNPLSYAPFVRANAMTPFATATIRYNDASGAVAQANYRAANQPTVMYYPAYNGGVHISIRGENGASLPGTMAGDSLYVIGQQGQSYAIVLQNTTPLRMEVVTSVDGLSVMTGQPADFSQRGYILNPYATLTIDGFRQSTQAVAAFRFGTVGDSYAAQSTGSARNVGVIGIALFHEQGAMLQAPNPNEIQLRETANPFPGQGGFAQPPPRRYYGP